MTAANPPEEPSADSAQPPERESATDPLTPVSIAGKRRVPAWKRPSRAQLLAAILLGCLGFALVTQVTRDETNELDGLRQSELVQFLDNLSNRRERLANERADLEAQQRELTSGTAGSASAIAAAKSRLDALGVLAGTVAAEGPGIVVTISDPSKKFTAAQLLGLVQELRDAGAEAIQIGSSRVVASTSFTENNREVAVDGIIQSTPLEILAIGDAQVMSTALQIPGGAIPSLEEPLSGKVKIVDRVKITALRPVPRTQFAQPAN